MRAAEGLNFSEIRLPLPHPVRHIDGENLLRAKRRREQIINRQQVGDAAVNQPHSLRTDDAVARRINPRNGDRAARRIGEREILLQVVKEHFLARDQIISDEADALDAVMQRIA